MNTLRNYRWSQRALGGLRTIQRPARYPRLPQAVTYWRRRFVALVIGLAVLALLSWAFSGALSVGGAGGRVAAGGGTARGTGQRASEPGAAASGKERFRRSRPCPRGEVVLSLFSGQASYGASQLPQFTVDVVATARQTCAFNVGARHIALVISAGSVRVWSSADCVQGAGSLTSDLQRGVPTVVPISWNRQASSPGCPVSSSTMPAGTYTATVIDGPIGSNSVAFRIG